jgi:hypothetical protein
MHASVGDVDPRGAEERRKRRKKKAIYLGALYKQKAKRQRIWHFQLVSWAHTKFQSVALIGLRETPHYFRFLTSLIPDP